MDVQLHYVIKKASVEEEKSCFYHNASLMQYEWNIER